MQTLPMCKGLDQTNSVCE